MCGAPVDPCISYSHLTLTYNVYIICNVYRHTQTTLFIHILPVYDRLNFCAKMKYFLASFNNLYTTSDIRTQISSLLNNTHYFTCILLPTVRFLTQKNSVNFEKLSIHSCFLKGFSLCAVIQVKALQCLCFLLCLTRA